MFLFSALFTSASYIIYTLSWTNICRVQKLIWEEQCALGQGGHISRLLTANLQNCED